MSYQHLRPRLTHGRPLVLDADTCACFRVRGVAIDTPGAVGRLLRSRPADVLDHYRAEVRSKVNVLSALTADTTPRALAEVGMEHRAAKLSGDAVDLALDAARESDKPVAVAGVVGSEMVAPLAADRLHAELAEHAQRLAAAGVELLLSRGQGSRMELMAAVVAAAATELPTWAVVECLPGGELAVGGTLAPLVESLRATEVEAVLFEVSSVDDGIAVLEVWKHLGSDLAPGVLLAGSAESVRGFPDAASDPVRWAARALELDAMGARVIGGGAGTTEAHTACLVEELTALHPSIPAVRA